MAAYGLGASLVNMGAGQQAEATEMLGTAAKQEQERDIQNQTLHRQEKAGNVQLGSTLGAAGGMAYGMKFGTAGGPWGMAIGALAGAVVGGLLS